MKILSTKQMKALMDEYPDGGIVFAEYTPDVLKVATMKERRLRLLIEVKNGKENL